MLRNLWFQLHWLLGITAGIVLAVVGVTGGLLSFEQDILRLLNPSVMTVTANHQPRLTPDELLARIAAAAPDKRITALSMVSDPHAAATVTFADSTPNTRRGETVYVDPYSGDLLGTPRGREFFLDVMRLHRWLLAGDIGKQIVGASTIALIALCLSGLYLRWPRRLLDWRVWLTFSFARKGRSFLWDLHAIAGTWALLLYLLASITGLYWSYEWYRNGLYALTGVERPAGRGPGGGQQAGPASGETPLPSLDAAWQVFEQTVAGYSMARLQLPPRPGQPLTITYLDPKPAHERAFNRFIITGATARSHERYQDKPLNEKLMSSMLPLHSGSFFGTPGLMLMMLASLAMPLFTITGWMLYLDRRHKKKAKQAAAAAVTVATRPLQDNKPVLVAYASQSGTAERLAWLSARALQAAGLPVTVRPLGRLGPDELGGYERALFALATFGDGQAPDNARAFAARIGKMRPALDQLRYGLLSLGDRAYGHYCGFGRSIDAWLQAHGAQPLFQAVEVDNGDEQALALWRQRLAALTDSAEPDWQESSFGRWRLAARLCLNRGGAGLPCFHLELEPLDTEAANWQAGDIAEVKIPASPQPLLREYSIASIPEDGRLHLLVRQVRQQNGSLGTGSGWLTAGLAESDMVALRIRSNSGFHSPADARPLILIGNGTGIAGLRAHLRARARAGHSRNWLIFGERNAAHDFHYHNEITSWLRNGLLERLDLAFSRDQAEKVYVQDCLRAAAGGLVDWLAQDAAIYVCGSAETMAPAVDRVLHELLGADMVARLQAQDRYQRDIY